MSRLDVAVTGATGLIGSRAVELLSDTLDLHPVGRPEGLDLARPFPADWERRVPNVDAVVHFAARANVDECETQRALGERGDAWIVNVEATKRLAQLAAARSAYFLHISTDYVFPVTRKGPFAEKDPVAATSQETNWYGWTKREAERVVASSGARHGILRLSHPYRAHYKGRLDHARRALSVIDQGQTFPAFADQFYTPAFVDDVVGGIDVLLRDRRQGAFHCASSDVVTPLDFVKRLLAATGRDSSRVARGSFDAYLRDRPTPRPKWGGLLMQESAAAGLPVRSTEDGIRRFADQLAAASQTSK